MDPLNPGRRRLVAAAVLCVSTGLSGLAAAQGVAKSIVISWAMRAWVMFLRLFASMMLPSMMKLTLPSVYSSSPDFSTTSNRPP